MRYLCFLSLIFLTLAPPSFATSSANNVTSTTVTQQPLELSFIKNQMPSVNSTAMDFHAFGDKVWVFNNIGAAVLQRTNDKLVQRSEIRLQSPIGERSARVYVASPDGSKVIALEDPAAGSSAPNTYTLLSLDDKFNISESIGTLSAINANVTAYRVLYDDVFLAYWSVDGKSVTDAFQLRNDGLIRLGTLPAIATVAPGTAGVSSTVISVKTMTVFTSRTTFDLNNTLATTVVSATKMSPQGNGETISKTITTDLLKAPIGYFVFDEISNELYLGHQTYYNYTIKYDPNSGLLDWPKPDSNNYSFSHTGTISDEYTLIMGDSITLLQRNPGKYTISSIKNPFKPYRKRKVIRNNTTNQFEYWQLDNRLNYAVIKNNSLENLYTQTSSDLGISDISSRSSISTENSPLLFIVRDELEVYKFDDTGIARINLVLPNNFTTSTPNKVVYLGDNYYAYIESNKPMMLLKHSDGVVSYVEDGAPNERVYINLSSDVLFLDNKILTKSVTGISLYNFSSGKITFLDTISVPLSNTMNFRDDSALVKLDGKVYVLSAYTKSFAEVKISGNKISIESPRSMPPIQFSEVYSAGDKLMIHGWLNGLELYTLKLNKENNLEIVNSNQYLRKLNLYKDKFVIPNYTSSPEKSIHKFDSTKNTWAPVNISECCDLNSTVITSGRYLAHTKFLNNSHETLLYRINTPPYLKNAATQLTINEGSPYTLPLNSLVVDDENDTLTFKGIMHSGFSISDTGLLTFNGAMRPTFTLDVSAFDSSLSTDVKLQFIGNFAPKLIKPLPDQVINEKQTASINLATYFTDIENHSFEFSSPTKQGISINKNGVLTGVLTSLTPFELTFNVTDSQGAVSQHIVTVKGNASPLWNHPASQKLVAGSATTIDLSTAFTDPESQNLSLKADNVPSGLVFNGKAITGTPNQAGTYLVTIEATDSLGAVGRGELSIIVDAAPTSSGGSSSPLLILLAALGLLRRRLH